MADPLILNPTVRRLKKNLPGLGGLLDFLELNALDVYHFHEDFDGGVSAAALTTGTDPEGKFALLTDNGGTALFTAASRNGVCTLGVIGTADNNYAFIYVPHVPCAGNLNSVLAVRLAIVTAVTNVKVEVGFADDPATDAGIVNVLATPNFNSSNGVAAVYDTDDAGNPTYWQLAGVKAGAAATKIEPAAEAPVADTYQTIIVGLRSTSAKMMILNEAGAVINATETAWMADAITAATGVSPWVGVQNRATTAKSILIDSVDFWQRRSST